MRVARSVTIVANAAAVACLVACGGGSTPKPTLTRDQIAQMLPLTSESEHFTYHYSDALPVDRVTQEAFYAWMAPQLGFAVAEDSVLPFRERGRNTGCHGSSHGR